MGRTKVLAAFAAAGLLLSSCIGIESSVTFRGDGSGVLKIEYRVAKSLADLASEGGSDLPLPVNEQELREELSQAKGLKLLGLSRSEDEKDVLIGAEIGFDRIESVAGAPTFADMPMSLERSGDDFVFRQVIGPAAEEQGAGGPAGQTAPTQPAGSGDSDKELAALFGQMLQGYELVLVVSAPRPVKSHSAGEISGDRKSVTWRLPLERAMELSQQTVLTVTW